MKNDRSIEHSFTATPKRNTKAKTTKAFDGGFHMEATPKRKKLGANKRSSTQTFTFG